jgi:hypothetical protein
MQRINAAPASERRPSRSRRLLYLAAGAAACLIVAIAVRGTIALRHAPQEAIANHQENGETNVPQSTTGPTVEPVMRTSTWSVVTEDVVLEGDVPVRELLYREFQRIEVLDAEGNTESHLVVPTKVMLLASEEQY